MRTEKELIEDLCESGLAGKYGEKSDPAHVKIWVRDGFHCVYCNTYLLADRIRISSAQFDHILPKSEYKTYADLEDNLVLSCYCCNQIKRNWDPFSKCDASIKSDLSRENFTQYRDQLIEKCREYLKEFLEKKDGILNNSISTILSKYRSIDKKYF